MKKLIVLFILLVLTLGAQAGHPCAHILICCRGANKGVTFEVNGTFVANHDYGDINQVRDILQKMKDAGIETVIIDMTNPSQWLRLREKYFPMIDNVATVCREKKMQYFIHAGGGFNPGIIKENEITQTHVDFWNDVAEEVWEKWAQTPEYRRYGFGDDRPILLIFSDGRDFMPRYKTAVASEKEHLEKFRLGTMQINEVVDEPMASDGWGYRSTWQNKSGSVRYTSTNGGVEPSTWYKIDAKTWGEKIRWVQQASEYSVYGSYDDSCDTIFWGIADTSKSERETNLYPDPANPRYYYDILREVLTEGAKVTSREGGSDLKSALAPLPAISTCYFAYSADGFNQDRDDVAGSAMAIALLDRAGLADRIAHFHFNTNFGGAPSHAQEHRKSVLETAVLFGIIDEVEGDDAFFDISQSADERLAAIAHLANVIRRSTPDQPLILVCGGGVQTYYLALKKAIDEGASDEALRSLIFFSHGAANEKTRRANHANLDYRNNWSNLKEISPTSRYIDSTSPLSNGKREGGVLPSQNSTAWNQAPRNPGRKGIQEWKWIAEYGEHVEGFGFSGTKGEWLLERLKAAGAPEIGHNGNAEGDASDAGMIFALLPRGKTDARMSDIRSFFIDEPVE